MNIKTKSIRFRILAWYSLTLFLVTAFIFVSFYVVTRQTLYHQVDQDLTSHAAKLTDIVTRQGINMHEDMLKQQLFNEFSQIPGMLVVLLDQNGNVIRSSLVTGDSNETYVSLFREAVQNTNPIYRNQDIGQFSMRFIIVPLRNNNSLTGVILVAHPIEVIQNSLNSLLNTLGIVFVVLLFPTILGGYLLAKQVMKPISIISDKMERITSERLGERVDSPGTDDEVEKLTMTFNRLLDRLQAAFQREKQFIGDVAHELKTPVATLRGETELVLSKNRSNKEYRQVIEEILVDANRLSTIIKNILDLAWLGAENARLGERKFNLSNAVTELEDIATRLAAQKNITLKGKVQKSIEIVGVEDKVSRAILNIIDNAIKYTSSGGKVLLSLSKKSNRAIVEIKDTGIGISEKELAHIFERFYRGSKSTKILGSGLGLAIAQGIIKAHQGEITVSSKVGKGTSITISLPVS